MDLATGGTGTTAATGIAAGARRFAHEGHIPAALARMSLGAQLALTRALVRNVVDRLELANSRVAR